MSELQLKSILVSIAQDRGFTDLAKYIDSYHDIRPVDSTKLKITVMPEATCDGCQ